jgi:hypothetical protein
LQVARKLCFTQKIHSYNALGVSELPTPHHNFNIQSVQYKSLPISSGKENELTHLKDRPWKSSLLVADPMEEKRPFRVLRHTDFTGNLLRMLETGSSNSTEGGTG